MDEGLISVDRWSEESQVYFLTHLHSDHTKGLSSKWKRGPLYCSPITAKLFPYKFPKFDLSFIRVLEIGSSHSISLISPTTLSQIKVHVTAIDAHHCPGSVMYLFRGEFGCMLYTGDFRWESTSDKAQLGKAMLLNALGGEKVDFLYLDNTYCHPSFSFPPREVAAQQVVDLIASHPDHEIIIGIDTLGKEDLLLHISRSLGTKICVWPERLQTMHLLGFDDIFTTNTDLTRVRAVPRYSFSIDTVKALDTIRAHRTIGILPSGLPWGVRPFEEENASSQSVRRKRKRSTNGRRFVDGSQPSDKMSSPRQVHPAVYTVSYSEHSCFSEIEEFIKLVQPSSMKGIVTSSFCYVNPLHYFGHLCGDHQQFDQSCRISKSNKPAEIVKDTLTECIYVCDKFDEAGTNKKGKMKITYSSGSKNRVTTLRRERRGAKIAETVSIL